MVGLAGRKKKGKQEKESRRAGHGREGVWVRRAVRAEVISQIR